MAGVFGLAAFGAPSAADDDDDEDDEVDDEGDDPLPLAKVSASSVSTEPAVITHSRTKRYCFASTARMR